MAKCGLCEKTIYATTTANKAVFDAYCISCRGLFNLYTYRGMTEQQAKDTIIECYAPVNLYKTLPAKRKHSVVTNQERLKQAKKALTVALLVSDILGFGVKI